MIVIRLVYNIKAAVVGAPVTENPALVQKVTSTAVMYKDQLM
jgi:hypothetical protein